MKTINKATINESHLNPKFQHKPLSEIEYNKYDVPLREIIITEEKEPGFMEKLLFIIKVSPKIISIIYKLLLLKNKFKGIKMAENKKDLITNWVAVGTGITTVVCTALLIFGITVPVTTQDWINQAITIIVPLAVTIVGFFTGKKTN